MGLLQANYFFVAVVFVSFAVLWAFFNWPALHSLWWAYDDFTFLDSRLTRRLVDVAVQHLRGGRPALVFQSLMQNALIAVSPSLESANIIMRWIQGLMHITLATMIGMTLRQLTGRRLAPWTVLPFLLWPFGGEATYWISAMQYPAAGILSLGGVLLCMRPDAPFARRALGAALILCATLTSQSGCLCGLMVFWMCILLSLHSQESLRRFRAPMLLIVSTYAIGAALPVLFALFLSNSRVASEATVPTALLLWHLFRASLLMMLYEPALYPLWLRIFQVAIVIIPAFVLVDAASDHHQQPHFFRLMITTLCGMAILVIIPCIPLFLLGLEWICGRLLYSTTLLFSTALCMIFRWRLSPRVNNALIVLLLCGQLAGYYPLARTFAKEHIAVYTNDLRTLRELEHIAQRADITALSVATAPGRAPMINPYELRFAWLGPSVTSEFSLQGTAASFINTQSATLHFVMDQDAQSSCLTFCENRQEPSVRSSSIISNPFRLLCFCA